MTVYTKDFVVNNGLQITGYITSVGGSGPANGQLLIGDATNGRWSVGSLTSSNGVTLSQGAGTIAISTNATSANTASTIVARDASGNFSAGAITAASGTFTGAVSLGSLTTVSATITGGSVNGTPIGATTASTGAFTTITTSGTATLGSVSTGSVTISGGTINGTSVGATTPSTGKFTTLTTTGQSNFGGRVIRSGSAYSAAGTTQATATLLTTDLCFINAASAANAGVMLPAAIIGSTCFVVNYSGQSIVVYPPSGNQVNYQASNVGMTMQNQSQLLFCTDGSTWFSMNATYA